jgi:hypothetical protein
MTTATTSKRAAKSRPVTRPDGFTTVKSKESLGYNTPQKMGRRLWLPMFVMALMSWGVGFVLSIVEAGTDRTDIGTLQNLGHLVPAFMFIGFLGIFASITFAVAKILGDFRMGGGEVQALTGAEVHTLKMPATAKVMLGLMMMGMMVMAAGIVVHFIAAASFDGVTAVDITDNAAWGAVGGALRRLGVAFYLTGITFGLGTIIEVLRFQSIRVQEVAADHGHDHS